MFREELETLAPHIEDSIRTGELDMYCSNSFLGGRPAKQYRSPLAVGDTVRITGPECKGIVGELKVIDMEELDGNHYGVRIDEIEGWIFFSEDELEKVDPKEVSQAGDPACTCHGRGCAWCNDEIYCAEEF